MNKQATIPQPGKETLQEEKKEVSEILSVLGNLAMDQLPSSSRRTAGKIQAGSKFKTNKGEVSYMLALFLCAFLGSQFWLL